MKKILSRSSALICAAVLAACGNTPSAPTYDVSAIETPGRIASKVHVGNQVQARADTRHVAPAMAAFGVVGALVAESMLEKASIPIYEYTVRTESGVDVAVRSEYFAFEVGDCVTLFQSNKPTYPRITRAHNCKNGT